ncbi:RNA methyltransferase [Fodinicola acaciae]|uniref:RNA methyltransferase n=1 Tax=Fodinicola acaciae TaxID=2681555 RepID=UPI0013D2577A|nr:RNA methyltransferase [Fodinicola acaciae]
MRLLARTVRGLEPVACAEIHERQLGWVESVRHREVVFHPVGDALTLRTVDDVATLVAEVDGIGVSTSDLRRLSAAIDRLEVSEIIGHGSNVDVSASVVGARRFNRYDVEDAVGSRLPGYRSRRGGVRPPDGLTWRVTIEGSLARVAVRLGRAPLHRRPYKVASVPGTLHPPVAAAMARLAGVAERHVVLDPCCGAGTTLGESPGLRVGFDLDVRAAAANLRGVTLAVADASALPLADGSVDRVLVNPPWGRAVRPGGGLTADLAPLWRELRRVVTGEAVVAALLPDGVTPAAFHAVRRVPIRVHGRPAVIHVLAG